MRGREWSEVRGQKSGEPTALLYPTLPLGGSRGTSGEGFESPHATTQTKRIRPPLPSPRLALPACGSVRSSKARRNARAPSAHIAWLMAISCLLPSKADADVSIQPVERHTNEFSGREITRSFRVKSDEPLAGRLVWNLKVQRRTLARGEQGLRGGKQIDTTIKFRLDALRDEVVLPATLTATIISDNEEVARQDIPLWFFADDPVANRSEWLGLLDIRLFDPSGDTAKRFSAVGLVVEETRNNTAIRDLDHGTLIIGSGISLADYRGLAPAVLTAASKGTRVLWLNAAEGTFPIDQIEASNTLSFADAAAIRRLDKRLDSIDWAGRGVLASKLRLAATRKQISLQIGEQGWPWVEVRWLETGGRFIYCGFPIIEQWDNSPTPRYMLLKTLERLNAEE